jgi:hypothetical protein
MKPPEIGKIAQPGVRDTDLAVGLSAFIGVYLRPHIVTAHSAGGK